MLLGQLAVADTTEPCPRPRLLYLPVETADEMLGLRGETRAGFLDRRYGPGRWRIDDIDLIRITAPQAVDEPIHVGLAELPGRAQRRIDVIVEARLDFLDAAERPTVIYGHRTIGSFAIEAGAIPTVRVPPSAFKEPGALVVAVELSSAGGAPGGSVLVQALAVDTAGCERRVYVRDRFTAIRRNRAQDR